MKLAKKDSDKNEFSDLSDHELVEAFGQTGDPWAFEMLKAEERRRTADKALKQALKSNKIAIGSLLVALQVWWLQFSQSSKRFKKVIEFKEMQPNKPIQPTITPLRSVFVSAEFKSSLCGNSQQKPGKKLV